MCAGFEGLCYLSRFPTVSSTTCGISSDSSASNAIGFVGNNGIQVSAPSYTVGGCSQTGGTQCTGVLTYQQPIPDPLSAVGAALAMLKTSDFPGGTAGQCASLLSYEAGSCCNAPTGNLSLNGTLNGTYYFAAEPSKSAALRRLSRLERLGPP